MHLIAQYSCSQSEWLKVHSKLIAWALAWKYFALYENQGGNGWDLPFKLLCAENSLPISEVNAFHDLELARKNAHLDLGGYLSYDLKNSIENLASLNPDRIKAPLVTFFEADVQIEYDGNMLTLKGENPEELYIQILNTPSLEERETFFTGKIKCGMQESEYLNKVQEIRNRIEEGDVYELNLCVEFFSEACKLELISAYKRLRTLSAAPMGAWLKLDALHVLSASPERFIKNTKGQLLSQPIKGTRPRSKNSIQDNKLKEELLASEKDRAENVMIVDLVRNDFAHSCLPGSIKVPELFGIYSFPQVHQMISSIEGQLKDKEAGMEALKYCFPMGSMTGAPKIMAMKIIDELENARRGIYSGAIGYISSNGDFDFNVVIRSLVYNEKDSVLSFQAGGAITYDSSPEEEWNELLVKASSVRNMLESITYPQDLPVT